MRAGRLRHRVAIQTYSESRDSFGGVSKSWSTDSTVWAAIEPLRGEERFVAQQREDVTTHRVVMRHNSAVTPEARLKFGSRIFAIKEVLDKDERGIWLELLCEEGAQDGS